LRIFTHCHPSKRVACEFPSAGKQEHIGAPERLAACPAVHAIVHDVGAHSVARNADSERWRGARRRIPPIVGALAAGACLEA
jgi:hypothetical protein